MSKSLLIVVPTLNSHTLIPRLLNSLQQQTWPYWQVLFIDGPSSAEHRQWIDQACAHEKRCRWLVQDSAESGIFGAMNQGFAEASPDDWLLFWGSDDWAPGPTVFNKAIAAIETAPYQPDLVVCRGRYVDAATGFPARSSVFQAARLLNSTAYRRTLFFGSTPPHQATLFGPGALRLLARYASGFSLSADLDYFLQLSSHPGLHVQCLDLELVHMSDAGVSGQQTQRRLQEVRRAYRRAFGRRWLFPFVARYIRRLLSLLSSK